MLSKQKNKQCDAKKEQKYWHTIKKEEIEKMLHTDLKNGITEEEAKKRLQEYGKNILEEKKKENIFVKFIKQFNDFMIIILIIAAIVSAIIAMAEGTGDYLDSAIIIAIVILNAIMGLVQEAKAEKSLEALKNMTAPLAKIKRYGKTITIATENVVPGDLIILEAGNYVPADARILECSNLKVEESNLTGETLAVEKMETEIKEKEVPIGDMLNMVHASTIVVNGHGTAIVTETGMNTKVGKIAKLIIEDESPQTPIQKKLAEVGKSLGIGCLIICIIIFVIGIFKKIPLLQMFMTSVGLAVAAIPEGLPAIVTIMLSIGVTKMAKKNSIIRKLPAVETLGSSNVICSDKTGTLTQNKMQVVKNYTTGRTSKYLIELACMCTDCEVTVENGKSKVQGEPTEVAILETAISQNIQKQELYQNMPRVSDIPFDSSRKMMTTIHKIGNKYISITKGAPDVLLENCGAPDVLLENCKFYDNGEQKIILDDKKKSQIIQNNENMAEHALRVIAVGYRILESENTNNIENELIFVGLIGMIDPPRKGVKEAVLQCRKAGIKTVMITGDHVITAKAIAKELGILKPYDLAMTGKELDKIDQKTLEKNIMKYSVFARVSPEHKVRIVKAFQRTGAVVAMTGDGVNDAPALKKADIGIAMGKNGTDVAKNAADMILADDNFVTIVEAVKQGRGIFKNIQKAIHFLIATNIGEIVTIFMGLVLGLKTPLLAIQLLWINLVTDSFPAIALGLEPVNEQIMKEKPRDSKKSIFADGLFAKIFTEGVMLGMLTLFAFSLGNYLYGLEVARTMAFVSLGILELVHSFNIKSEESIFKIGILENKYLLGSFLLGIFMQVIVVVVKPIAEIFDLVALNNTQWLLTILISIMPIVIIELQKKFNEIKFGRKVYVQEKKILN